VLLAFTLIRKEGVRNEFWGQAIVDGASVLDTKRNKLRINLGDLKVRTNINQSNGQMGRGGIRSCSAGIYIRWVGDIC
jgi:hypothetical protein